MRTGGFTLLELVVVVFIIGILMTLIVPSLNDGRSRSLNDMSHQMVLLINQARQEAVLSSRIWEILFDREAGVYSFRQLTGTQFKSFADGPFAPVRTMSAADINGEPVPATAAVYLFPTGEQDAFRLVLSADGLKSTVVMGPVGPARGRLE